MKPAESLSEQQIVDCSSANFGCQGGLLQPTVDFVSSGPIFKEGDYPYREAHNGQCFSKSLKGAEGYKGPGFKKIEPATAGSLHSALEDGPVVASIRAGNRIFRHYHKGVIKSEECTSSTPERRMDHAVLVVGLGTSENGLKYYIIKNSFSTQWGEDGYARIAADD